MASGSLCNWTVTEVLGVRRRTLANLLPAIQRGRYIVCKTGHAFAVVDGVVMDCQSLSGPRSRIRTAWRLTRPEPVAPIVAAPVKATVYVQPKQRSPWAVDRYFELRAKGKLDQAARLFNHTTDSVQRMILADSRYQAVQ
jgi:hypothetical protein